MTQATSDGLVLLDPARRRTVVDRIRVGVAPWAVELSPDGATAYVSTAEGLAVVDLASRRRTALIGYRNQPATLEHGEYRAGGMGLAVSPGGDRVYVAVHRAGSDTSQGDALEVVDTERRAVTDVVEVGLRPFDVEISSDGRQVYTVDHDSFGVHAVDTRTLRTRRFEVAPFGTEGGLGSWEKPHYAVLDNRGRLLLPYQGRTLVRLDPATGRSVRLPMTANTHQHGVTRTPDGRLLVVGTGSFGNATGAPSLTVRDRSGAERVLPLERPHEEVALWHADGGGEYAVLTGGYTRPGGFDGVTLVDLVSGSTREVAVPGHPQGIAIPR